jgi:hypothetical protein
MRFAHMSIATTNTAFGCLIKGSGSCRVSAMAAIVLVHGIDQQQKSAEVLEEDWVPALARGVSAAGFPDVADRIWLERGKLGSIEVRMAFYGNLFLTHGVQGGDAKNLTPDMSEFADSLALEWLRRAAERATNQKTCKLARRELNYVTHQLSVEQGTGQFVRSAAKSLAKISWFAPFGMGFAERFVYRSLAQVTRYFTQQHIRAAALKSVLDLISQETKALIGHSLGSVVAYEAAHYINWPLPLLVTLGSPLGIETIIYDRLQPQPPSFPSTLKRWVNVADRDDFIAAEPNLEGFFSAGKPIGATLEGTFTQDSGAEPHSSYFYLGRKEVGGPVGELFHTGAAPSSA